MSRAKVTASKENGKKGGRPPKEITNLKRRKGELEESVLPDLRREKSVTTDFEKEEKIAGQILEYENELMSLQITAIEQLNALKRELFTTSWRLADEYNFSDKYRLTERQIEQYNEILMDQDPIRRYRRLDSIKDNFLAYPAFWYFIGNAANQISRLNGIEYSEDFKNHLANALKID